jgi:hypothetical protein
VKNDFILLFYGFGVSALSCKSTICLLFFGDSIVCLLPFEDTVGLLFRGEAPAGFKMPILFPLGASSQRPFLIPSFYIFSAFSLLIFSSFSFYYLINSSLETFSGDYFFALLEPLLDLTFLRSEGSIVS